MIRKLLRFVIPPDKWKVPVIITLGIFFGLGGYLFYIAKAHSYLSDSPTTCVNCHIMAPQYSTWFHSSHREVAVCNDCHVPQDNIFNHYKFKAEDGLRHSAIFTLRAEPQVIHIREAGIKVVQNNCIRCHQDLLESKRLQSMTGRTDFITKERLCWECHRDTPHGRVNSLSSTPNAKAPVPQSPVPQWLKKVLN
ncbi:MAG: cytochrome c nitrite reductase small subunit [Bacteroidetes bacterium HGW-Bacteroidetes-19]|nr:MAG: cytochrome c nitrite reductase small subunit [Bacteroidetes bacterium HGW-Bacteroidetes-20]PKP28472.1 MAG: cytochrome c nitrite reductase small subunit [Bacteroidetes bacterium HGW-Bacteroidetes-19]